MKSDWRGSLRETPRNEEWRTGGFEGLVGGGERRVWWDGTVVSIAWAANAMAAIAAACTWVSEDYEGDNVSWGCSSCSGLSDLDRLYCTGLYKRSISVDYGSVDGAEMVRGDRCDKKTLTKPSIIFIFTLRIKWWIWCFFSSSYRGLQEILLKN